MRGSLLKRGETWSYVLYLGRGADGKKQQKWVGGFRTRRRPKRPLQRRSRGCVLACGPIPAARPWASISTAG